MIRPSIAILVLLAGCGGGGDVGPDAALPRQLTYTPRGCGYTVSTPEVLEAEPGTSARGAQPAPTQVHVSWAGSPTTSFAVNWMSDADTKLSQVLYGTDQALVSAADGPATEAGPLGHQDGHTLVYSSVFPAGETRLHEAHVCGLMADTRYFYKVGGPGAWSKVFDITTAPMAGTAGPFKFAVSGDSRDNPTIFADVQQRIAAAGPDFQLFSGDAVLLGASEGDWRKWFDATSTSGMAAEEVLARVPFMFADGNHESLSQIFLSRFAFPQELSDGESGEGEDGRFGDEGQVEGTGVDEQEDGMARSSGLSIDFPRHCRQFWTGRRERRRLSSSRAPGDIPCEPPPLPHSRTRRRVPPGNATGGSSAS